MSDDVHKFWDLYQDTGIQAAVDFARDVVDGEADLMQSAIPSLVLEAKARKIDMVQFLEELDELEQEDAARADNDGGRVPADSDSQADLDEDADVSSEARAADGEDRGEDEVSPPSPYPY